MEKLKEEMQFSSEEKKKYKSRIETSIMQYKYGSIGMVDVYQPSQIFSKLVDGVDYGILYQDKPNTTEEYLIYGLDKDGSLIYKQTCFYFGSDKCSGLKYYYVTENETTRYFVESYDEDMSRIMNSNRAGGGIYKFRNQKLIEMLECSSDDFYSKAIYEKYNFLDDNRAIVECEDHQDGNKHERKVFAEYEDGKLMSLVELTEKAFERVTIRNYKVTEKDIEYIYYLELDEFDSLEEMESKIIDYYYTAILELYVKQKGNNVEELIIQYPNVGYDVFPILLGVQRHGDTETDNILDMDYYELIDLPSTLWFIKRKYENYIVHKMEYARADAMYLKLVDRLQEFLNQDAGNIKITIDIFID